ncbi:MAG: hypothetical protein PHS60_12550 [Zavarzinia sp.]|nr:hypothetical protein [Zavarzinia sp.]
MPEWLQSWWGAVALGTPLVVTAIGWAVRKGLASQKDLEKEKAARAAELAAHAETVAKKIAEEAAMRDRDYSEVTKRLVGIDRRLDRGEDRFERIGLRLDQMPTKDDIHDLSKSITGLVGSVGQVGVRVEALSERLSATDGRLQMLDEYLREDSLIEKQRAKS